MWALVHFLSTSSNQDSPLHTRHTQRTIYVFRQYCRVLRSYQLLWPFPALRCVKHSHISVWAKRKFRRAVCKHVVNRQYTRAFREATVEQKSKLETRDTLRTVQATSKRSKTKLMKKHTPTTQRFCTRVSHTHFSLSDFGL